MTPLSGKRVRRLLAASTLALAASACTPTVSTHGHPLDPEQVTQIKPGVTSREEVTRLLGSPSTIGTFEQERWFYVSQRNEVMSFYKADVTQQDVVRIDFDANGIVSDVHTHGLELAQAIEPDPNRTRTLGNELTAMRQLLGNIGRFNTSGDQTPRGAGGPGGPGGGF
jgi:outer membrane protein assembly factor BamE (lipoprotein component of BamABCDE complex)